MSVQLIQIFKVDAPQDITVNGKTFPVYAAQTALLDADGVLTKVGRLSYREEMIPKIKTGVFKATFGLDVAGWGKNKGDIISVITDLVPHVPGAPDTPAPATVLKTTPLKA